MCLIYNYWCNWQFIWHVMLMSKFILHNNNRIYSTTNKKWTTHDVRDFVLPIVIFRYIFSSFDKKKKSDIFFPYQSTVTLLIKMNMCCFTQITKKKIKFSFIFCLSHFDTRCQSFNSPTTKMYRPLWDSNCNC